ncbi:taurine ABC transporter substrate-binding protein [Enemella evansiae]|nr:taurine ABC transporter substrate-binding protein [Enemella evansiae]OYO10900.1 taurine ABC transporter substrate-binding protein [Enemella evansiae]
MGQRPAARSAPSTHHRTTEGDSMNRRHFLASLGAAALAAGVAGCTRTTPGSGAAAGGEPLTIGLTYTPDIQFAPFYLAESAGHFEAQGVRVTLRHHGANEQLLGALQAGTEQLVYAGGDELLQARSQGVAVTDIATLYQEYPVVAIVREESPIRSAADLRGRRIGVPGPYGETWFGLLALLETAGLKQGDVQVQNIGYTQQAALTSNQVEVVMGYANNDAVRFAQAGVPIRSLPLAEEQAAVPLVGVGLGAADQVLQTRAEDLRKVINAVRRGIDDLVADPNKAVEAAKKYVPNLSVPAQQQAALATLEATIPLFGDPATAGQQDPARWESMAEFMQQMGLLAKPVPAAEAYTDTLLN